MVRPYVIIGTGAAGMAAAERLRLLKPDIPIQMMSIDEYSHSRCMLHKYLGGERDEKGLSFVAEDFFEKSFSFVAVKDNKIVGIIFGSGRYEKCIPIDIEVLEEHRKKGIARALTIAFVMHCMKDDLVPHWDCVESNKASIHLAESAGFTKIKERPFYWFDI